MDFSQSGMGFGESRSRLAHAPRKPLHSGMGTVSAMGKMLTILLAAVLGVVAPSWANQIVQYAPGHSESDSDVGITIRLINDDNGAIYNSYDLSLLNSLAVALFALPRNQTIYSSVEDLVSDWSGGVFPGEVDNKWTANLASVNPISITHSGLGYDQWYATQQHEDQDTLSLVFQIPLTQLDGDGDGYSLADGMDYHVTTNSVPTADMGVGIAGLDSWSAQGYEYGVALNGDGKITQCAPDYVANPGVVTLPIEIKNNDNGAIYNSYDLYLLHSLVESVWALPCNQTNYASVDDMLATWQLEIASGPVGEVNAGWNANVGDYNPVVINNIDGDINIDYDGWYATQQNPNQDMMSLIIYIPLSQLDGDGDGYSLTDGMDYHVTTNSVPTADMGVGWNGGIGWAAQGYEYGVALNGGSEPATGRFEMGTMELGLPSLTITNSPNTVTVIVQRCDGGLTNGGWQTITNLVPGTTQWTDETATGAWEQLYYRLAK